MSEELTDEKLRPVIANYESIIKHKEARIKELVEWKDIKDAPRDEFICAGLWEGIGEYRRWTWEKAGWLSEEGIRGLGLHNQGIEEGWYSSACLEGESTIFIPINPTHYKLITPPTQEGDKK